MRRWLWLLGALAVCAVVTSVAVHHLRLEARRKRELDYQAAVRAYTQQFRPGLRRGELDSYFRASHIKFGAICCLEERSAPAGLVLIGQEDHPWYCSENDIYVAFEFVAEEPHKAWEPFASDTLTRIHLFPHLGGCL